MELLLDTDRTILITGGAGFIGINASEWFMNEGYDVIIFDNLSRETHKLIRGDRKFKEKYFLYYENPKAKTESEKKTAYDYYKF